MKNLKILIYSLLFVSLTACGGGGGGGGAAPQEDPFAKPTGPHDTDDVRPISFSAVYGAEVQNSVCISDIPYLEDFNRWAERAASQPPLSDAKFVLTNSGGVENAVKLFNQNQSLTEALAALVFQQKDISPFGGKMQPVLGKNVYSRVPSNCESIGCVAEAVFSKSYGARLYFRQNYGFLISEHADERMLSGFISDDRIESVLYAIGTLPRNMLPLATNNFHDNFAAFNKNVILSPFKKGSKLTGSGADTAAVTSTSVFSSGESALYADVNIYLYDNWQNTPSFYDRAYVVFHEFMHMFDKGRIYSESADWLALAKWQKQGSSFKLTDNAVSCSHYGASSPQEDFAECGALFRFAPLRLKAISLAKYNFFKNKVFGGIEFLEPRSCAHQVSNFADVH